MGEVWKARDTRVDRTVAIKFCHADFSERFAREARAIAALNHPHICQLYDVGPDYLVMEYVEGEPVKGPVPVDRALVLAGQISDALAAAHAKGIVHRDLKPANILVTRTGVKLLDFGLAKMGRAAVAVGEETVTKALTGAGTILGTLQYMAPEQLQGKEADERSDIFSFGVVLYEMLTGRRAFAAGSAASLIAEVLKEEPAALSTLQPGVPRAVERVVETCLKKDPEERWQSAREVRHALEWAGDKETVAPVPAGVPRMVWPVLAAIGFALFVAGLLVMRQLGPEERGAQEQLRFTPIAAEEGFEGYPSFSPDGRSIAYSHTVNGIDQVFVRAMASGAVAQLTDSADNAYTLGWARDSSRIYYETGLQLWVVSASGGTPKRIMAGGSMGSMAISPDGNHVVISENTAARPRLSVSSPPGAALKLLAELPSPNGFGMAFSPDGRKLLAGSEEHAMVVQFPSGRVSPLQSLHRGFYPAWLPDSRHAVFAVPKAESYALVMVDTESDASRLLLSSPQQLGEATVSPDGSRIAYSGGMADYDVIEMSLDGKKLRPLVQGPLIESAADWSPKGDRFVYVVSGSGIWMRNADGSNPRLLVNDAEAYAPAFSPDGRRVAFRHMSKGIRAMQATGGESALLSKARVTTAPLGGLCWSPDGAWIAFTDGRGGRSRAGTLRRVEASGGGRSMDMIVGVSNAIDAGCTWSPDGRWIAYLGEGGVHVVSPEGKDDHIVIPTIHRASLRFNKRGELAAILPGQSDVFETYDLSGRLISSVPLDLAPQIGVSHFCFTPDGRRMAVTIYDLKYDIWMIEGFARPTTGLMRFFRHWTIP